MLLTFSAGNIKVFVLGNEEVLSCVVCVVVCVMQVSGFGTRSRCWCDEYSSSFTVSQVSIHILLHAVRRFRVWRLSPSGVFVRNLVLLVISCLYLLWKDVLHNPDDGLHYGLCLLQR